MRVHDSKHQLTPQEGDGICGRLRGTAHSSGTSEEHTNTTSCYICWLRRTLLFMAQDPTPSCSRLFRADPKVPTPQPACHVEQQLEHSPAKHLICVLPPCYFEILCLPFRRDPNSHWGNSRVEVNSAAHCISPRLCYFNHLPPTRRTLEQTDTLLCAGVGIEHLSH